MKNLIPTTATAAITEYIPSTWTPAPDSETSDQIADREQLEAEQKARKRPVPTKYRDRYKAAGDATCCGDDISATMKIEGNTPDAVRAIAEQNGLTAKWEGYTQRAKPLNNGMVRMNIGNLLRGKLKKGNDIQIGDTEYLAENYEI